MQDLAGNVAVVTGAGRGIGRQTAVRLAGLGARVALVARNEQQLKDTAALVAQEGGEALALAADVSDPRAVDALKARIVEAFGAPSILVNAAGTFGPIQLAWNADPDAWIATLMANTVGSFLTSRAFVQGMMERGWGRIINVSSAASIRELGPTNSAYGTSKAALNQFTRHLAAEIAGTGVTANVIHPGDIKTDMWREIREAAEVLGAEGEPYRKWADRVEETGGDDPEKACDLIVALLGDNAAGINGRFLWIKDGIRTPIPSWGRFAPDEVWSDPGD